MKFYNNADTKVKLGRTVNYGLLNMRKIRIVYTRAYILARLALMGLIQYYHITCKPVNQPVNISIKCIIVLLSNKYILKVMIVIGK